MNFNQNFYWSDFERDSLFWNWIIWSLQLIIHQLGDCRASEISDLGHQVQQPIPNLRILKFSQLDYFLMKIPTITNKQRRILLSGQISGFVVSKLVVGSTEQDDNYSWPNYSNQLIFIFNLQAVGSLNYHKTNTHADKTVQDFKCGECDFKSYAKRYVLSHIRKVHRGLNYKHVCEHCGDKFAYPSDLKSHTVIILSEVTKFINPAFKSTKSNIAGSTFF